MKKLSTIILIFFLNAYSYGQVAKTIYIPKYKNGETSLWYKANKERETKIGLQHLINSTGLIYFRFWTNAQVVDLWTNDNKLYFGLITNFIDSYEPNVNGNQKRKPLKTFFNHVPIDTSSARIAFNLFKNVSTIPPLDSIKGWGVGCDGITYIFEVSTPNSYTFKNYWTPTSQDSSLTEAKQIQAFVENIQKTLNLEQNYSAFYSTLKPGAYSCDNMISYKSSPKQIKKWEKSKPDRDYLESIKDTLNEYLSITLTKLFHDNNIIISDYEEITLRFSKKNKLKLIRTNTEFLSSSERKKLSKLRKDIIKVRNQLHIDFVHSKVGYWKRISFWDNKIRILN